MRQRLLVIITLSLVPIIVAICPFHFIKSNNESGWLDNELCYVNCSHCVREGHGQDILDHYNQECSWHYPGGKVAKMNAQFLAWVGVSVGARMGDVILDGVAFGKFQLLNTTTIAFQLYNGTDNQSCHLMHYGRRFWESDCDLSIDDIERLWLLAVSSQRVCRFFDIYYDISLLTYCNESSIHKKMRVICEHDQLERHCHQPSFINSKCDNCTTTNKVGTYCQLVRSYCHENPCKNRGLCYSSFQRYKCLCRTGWTGVHCEIDIRNGIIISKTEIQLFATFFIFFPISMVACLAAFGNPKSMNVGAGFARTVLQVSKYTMRRRRQQQQMPRRASIRKQHGPSRVPSLKYVPPPTTLSNLTNRRDCDNVKGNIKPEKARLRTVATVEKGFDLATARSIKNAISFNQRKRNKD